MRRLLKPIHWTVTFQLRSRLREQRIVERLRESDLLDVGYYRSSYPDVDTQTLDPLVHYVRHGAAEGRNPNAYFDTAFYLATNPDVATRSENPLDHFHSHGWREGRDPHPDFSVAYYLDAHSDVRDLEMDPLQHYLQFGRAEGRSPLPPVALPEPEPPVALPTGPSISLRRIARAAPNAVQRSAADDPIVLCAAHLVPFPPRAGNQLRIHRMLRWLEHRGYQTVMICFPLPGEELDESELDEATRGIANFVYCERSGEVRACVTPQVWALLRDLDGEPAVPLDLTEGEESDAELAATEATFCPDVAARVALHLDAKLDGDGAVITNYVFSTRFLPELCPSTLKIIDTHDVFSTKEHKVAAYGVDGEMHLSPDDESRLLRRADVLLAIQPDEARELEALAPDRRVISAGIDFEPAPASCVALPSRTGGAKILFIASGNALNVKGLQDFLQYAWPLLQRDHPDATLLVAGAIGDHVPKNTPGVRVLGFVESLEGLYRSCHVVINPAVAGTGLKIKTLEALAAHRPLVTWPLGVDGLPAELKQLCLVASDWFQFYVHVSGCLQSPKRESFSATERDRIAAALSPAHTYKFLVEVLDEHCRRRERSRVRVLSAPLAQAAP